MKFNLRGLLQDEEFLLGAGLLSAGSQGQNVGQAVFPSLLQAAKVKKAFGDTAKSTKPVWSIKDGMNVLVSDQMIKADKDSGVNNYLPAKKTDKKRTISDEALKVYDKLQGLTGPAFDNAFEALPENEKNVYIKQIKGNENILNAFLKKALTEKNNKLSMNLSNYELSGKATNNYKSVEDLISVIKSQKGNENFTDIEIIQSLINEGLLQVRG
jgi:hypothetical protein